LVVLLSAALVGTGLPAKTVTGSKVPLLEGMTPMVQVLSAGTERIRQPFQQGRATFHLEVLVFVRQAMTGWTNAQAEDALDRIESLIAGVTETNTGTANWSMINYTDQTTVYEIDVGGIAYYMERIPLEVILTRS